jgi:hypothetical protein
LVTEGSSQISRPPLSWTLGLDGDGTERVATIALKAAAMTAMRII